MVELPNLSNKLLVWLNFCSAWQVDEVKQQTVLVHKAPKKVYSPRIMSRFMKCICILHLKPSKLLFLVLKDGTVGKNTINTKLKLTIPREPELETAHRAQRLRLVSGLYYYIYTEV